MILRLFIYNYFHLNKIILLILTSIIINLHLLYQTIISAELKFNIIFSFFNLIIRKEFITIYNFFNNNIFFISNNINFLLYFLIILTIVTTRKDYKDIEIELNITSLYS